MKKNILKYFAPIALVSMLAVSCDDFGDINKNPNKPSDANTAMLFARACLNVRGYVMGTDSYDPWNQLWTGYVAETKNNQFGELTSSESYNTSGTFYYCIKQLSTIAKLNSDEATKSESFVRSFGSNDNQIAVATTLKAFYVMTLSDIVGPLPYTQSLKGESDGIWEPEFDSQELIYSTLNSELEEVYSKFDTSSSLDGQYDILYGGDVAKWKKFNATLRMMMAIKLADVAPSVGKERFAKAYADGGMTNVSDGFNYTFDAKGQYAWFYYIGNLGYSGYSKQYTANKFIVDKLKEYQDPRMFAYFTLDGYMGKVDGDPKDFNAYKGVTLGQSSNDKVTADAVGACSVQQKYCEMTATYGLITTARCLLVEAEAAKLGWISANANELYEAGIRASFEFSGAEDVDNYIAAHPLPSGRDEALKEIVMQRWLAGFLTDGIETWSDWRRYNIPYLPLTDHQKETTGHKTYPYRFMYYSTESELNAANYKMTLHKYYGAPDPATETEDNPIKWANYDSRWSRVWWDVADNAE